MDPHCKQVASARPATNFEIHIRPQPFSNIRRNGSSQAQSEDRCDESSSIGSLSTVGKSTKCLKCNLEARMSDPLCRPCSKCSARWHFGCHHPPMTVEPKLEWRCARCIKKFGLLSKEPSLEAEPLGSFCEVPGCNKTIYSMMGTAKLDRILCKHHEMVEKSERSKLASKAHTSTLSRPYSRPFKKSKLYPVKYDEDMQEMKRKPGRKPGDMKRTQLPSARSPVRSNFSNKPTAKPTGIQNLESVLAARGALHPRNDNAVHVPKSTSVMQQQPRIDSPSNTKDAWAVPNIQNRPMPSLSQEYELPSPTKFDSSSNYSPEYEPPSPGKFKKNASIWESDIEEDDSPGSQIKDKLRAMQESGKKDATEPTGAFARGSSSPPISPSYTKTAPVPKFPFDGNNRPAYESLLLAPPKVVEASSSPSSITDVPSAMETLKLLAPMSFLGNTVNYYAHPPNSENNDRGAPRSSKKRKASPQEGWEAEKDPSKEKSFSRLTSQNFNNFVNKVSTSQPPERPREPGYTAPQLQQMEATPKEPQHHAPLYGDYKPHTIEYKRQLRAKTYDSTVLDHYLSLQIESQARAEVEREQNLMPQPYAAAKTQIWGNIDPRVVWPKEQPEGWYETKRKEIDARGGKKANFGILLTAQVRKERNDRGWHPNQNKDYVPKDERNGGSLFVGGEGHSRQVELAIRGNKLGVIVPAVDKDGRVKAEKKFLPGDG
ncbi:hypothetical protein DID88_000949 [Monilinia fructigena]|uniref:Zinc finger PHD-type domain-containing protein n=1 Tax=Monilinia fructigena TaxID=38457 RepID=A0A395IYZ1_9HELO|nr:hypothetical protein DID88_000949 [Monilinia fructigena]